MTRPVSLACLAVALALPLGALTGCSSTSTPTTEKGAAGKAAAPTPAAIPLPGRVRAQRGLDVAQGSDFDFGGGRRVRAARPARDEEPTQPAESNMRPQDNTCESCVAPWPGSPSTASGPSTTSSKMNARVDKPRRPSFRSSG